jgi:hypothetical protein
MVETGHLSAMNFDRNPCNSSSQTFSTVPAFPSVRTNGFADQFGLRRTVIIQNI